MTRFSALATSFRGRNVMDRVEGALDVLVARTRAR
jgi:hypothetical protein